MGRIQSSVGLITGTNIVSTVDQLIAISGQPRDRLLSRTESLRLELQAIGELTASVIGVQLAGERLANGSSFRSKTATSSNQDALSAVAGVDAAAGKHVVRTLATAATHRVQSLQRFDSVDEALGFTGKLSIHPDGGLINASAELANFNSGRGVEPGTVRITDRAGFSADIDFSDARTIDDVLTAINDADIGVRATTEGNSIKLVDETGSTVSNLKVEQLGHAETAADLGLWGINEASSSVTGVELELPDGVTALRGTALSELGGGSGIGPLGTIDITLSDGSQQSIDLSAATTTSEVIDAIDAAGLSLIVKYNDARNGLQIRDVSGGSGTLTISSSDDTASALGLEASTTDDIVVGSNLNRQTVTNDTRLVDLNQGLGIKGSFTITDSNGTLRALNITSQGITTVGGLIDAINNLGVGVTASLNQAGDGIAVVDTVSGSETLKIEDSGTGTAAKDLGIAGTATDQTIGGSVVSALVGTQADVITVEADDTLTTLTEKINENSRYAAASIQTNDDGSFSLRLRGTRGGEAGRIAINSSGFELGLRTESRGQDALIAVSTDGASEHFLKSSDGVFNLDGKGGASAALTSASLLSTIASEASRGSFTITDSRGSTSAINLTVQGITTVGQLVDAVNELGIGVTASINEDATGVSIIDTAGGTQTLTIADVGNGKAASSLGIAGKASTKTISGQTVSALVGSKNGSSTTDPSGVVFTLKQLTDSPISVTISEDTSGVVTSAKTFVEQYNKLIDKLNSLTFFNADTNEVGLLFGSGEAQRISSGFSRLLSGTINGAGDLKSVGQVGIGFNDQGKLELNEAKLSEALTDNAAEVEAFFTTKDSGLADRINSLSERIAGVDGGLLLTRNDTLIAQIDQNNGRIETMNSRLEKERERLLNRFYATETAIAKIQTNSSAIDQIQRIEIPT